MLRSRSTGTIYKDIYTSRYRSIAEQVPKDHRYCAPSVLKKVLQFYRNIIDCAKSLLKNALQVSRESNDWATRLAKDYRLRSKFTKNFDTSLPKKYRLRYKFTEGEVYRLRKKKEYCIIKFTKKVYQISNECSLINYSLRYSLRIEYRLCNQFSEWLSIAMIYVYIYIEWWFLFCSLNCRCRDKGKAGGYSWFAINKDGICLSAKGTIADYRKL